MERSTMMRAISQQSMFNIIEPSPPPYIAFPQKTNSKTIKDASFSSYLNLHPEEPNNKDHQTDDSELSIFDAQKYFNDSATHDPKLGNRVSPSPVVNNVINLERISERCEYFPSVPRLSSASSSVDGYGRNYRARSFHATPTASSEASWNSQTGLLSHPPGAIAVSMRNPPSGDDKRRGSASKWILGRKCPCSGKKSVQVEEKLSEPRTPSRLNYNHPKMPLNLNKMQSPVSVESSSERSNSTTPDWIQRQPVLIPNSHRISAENNRFPLGHHHNHRVMVAAPRPFSVSEGGNGFTFPILSQTTASSTAPVKLVLNGLASHNSYSHPSLEEPPRDSLEVFRPADDPISTKPETESHRRQSFTFPGSPKSTRMTIDDDMASDASSDLFEIESFSTQTTTYPMQSTRRDSLEDASSFNARRMGGIIYRRSVDEPMTPSIAGTEGYEPSEASIDWSVTTAEGFERGSVTNYSVTASEADETRRMNGGGKKRGGLLSCRCEKAVSVGPQPVRWDGQRGPTSTSKHVSSHSNTHIIRAPTPTTSHNNNINMKKLPPLARSHSARLSLPFPT